MNIAFKFFMSTTLAVRMAGLNLITVRDLFFNFQLSFECIHASIIKIRILVIMCEVALNIYGGVRFRINFVYLKEDLKHFIMVVVYETFVLDVSSHRVASRDK